jgi:hypothetical protein
LSHLLPGRRYAPHGGAVGPTGRHIPFSNSTLNSNLRRICFYGAFFVKRRKKLNFRKKKDEKNLKKGVAFREKGAIIRSVRSV